MQATTHRPKITATADGAGVVSHAGTRLLTDLADATTMAAELSAALLGVRGPRPRHGPGRVLVDLAVAIADGAETISDIAALTDQPALFGRVASDSTCWRLLAALDALALARVAAARARAREVAWADSGLGERIKLTGRGRSHRSAADRCRHPGERNVHNAYFTYVARQRGSFRHEFPHFG